jgi:pyruvate dehydrogenase E1 component
MKNFANQIRAWVPNPYYVLGTDGFGRSDSRQKLRHFFEVDRYWITYTALKALADSGVIKPAELNKAKQALNIDPNKPNPVTV